MNSVPLIMSVAVEPKTKARPGEDGHGAGEAGAGRSQPSRSAPRSPMGRRSSPAWASCIWDHRRPHDARVQGRGQRGKPQVNYRETIPARPRLKAVHSTRRVVRATTATPRFVSSPTSRARATSSRTTSRAVSIPKEYIKPIDQGIQEAMAGGVLAGYEMVDIKVSAV